MNTMSSENGGAKGTITFRINTEVAPQMTVSRFRGEGV